MQRTTRASLAVLVAVLPLQMETEPSLPRPDLSGLEPTVQTQLRDFQSLVTATFKDAASTRSERADVVGRLGQVYHAYELNEAAIACYTKAQEHAVRDGPECLRDALLPRVPRPP